MTKTYILRSTSNLVAWASAGYELAMNTGTDTSAGLGLLLLTSSPYNYAVWTTPPGEPGSADWPTASAGDPYELVVDVKQMGANVALSATNSGFYRLNNIAGTAYQSIFGVWDSTTGTGLKTLTNQAWNPMPGLDTDRFGVLVEVTTANTMMDNGIELGSLNTTAVYARGPWTSGPTPISGSGGVAWGTELSAAGTVVNPTEGSGGVVWGAELAAAGALGFVGSGGVAWDAALAAEGALVIPIEAAGGVAWGVSLAAEGGLVLPVEAAGGVAWGASLGGSAALGFVGGGAIAWGASLSGSSALGFAGTGAIAWGASLSAQSLLAFSGSGGVAWDNSLAGQANLLFTGVGAVEWTHALDAVGSTGTAQESFTGSGGVEFTPSLAASGFLAFTAAGGVEFTSSLSGAAFLAFSAAGGVAFSPSFLGSASLAFVGAGSLAFDVSLAGLGTSLLAISAAGGVVFTVGFESYGVLVVPSGPNEWTFSVAGTGMVLRPSGSSLTLRLAMIQYFEAYDLLTTELQKRVLQRNFVARWGVYPARIFP